MGRLREGHCPSLQPGVLLSSLEGGAVRVIANIPPGCVSYTTVAQQLCEMFTPEANIIAYKAQFQCRMRSASEDAHAYAMSLRDLATKAYLDMGHQGIESMLVDQYIKGQPPIRLDLASSPHRMLQEAVAATIRLEAYSRPVAALEPVQSVRRTPRNTVQATQGFRPFDTMATRPPLSWD